MNELKDLYTISCEEYYLDTYAPDYESGSTEEFDLKFDENEK